MKTSFFLNQEMTTHVEAQIPLIHELEKRIDLKIVYYKYGGVASAVRENLEADIYIADIISPFSKMFSNTNKPFIFVPHGISAFKPFRPTKNCTDVHTYILPTEEWCKQFKEKDIKHNLTTSKLVNANGWSKMDIYFDRLKNREEIKAKIYKKYNLKKDIPLIIYTPTGIRPNAETLEKWRIEYKTSKENIPNGYILHGSYYLREQIMEEVNKTELNFIELPHPCVQRGEIDKDRIDIMIASDILISDISSMAIEYLALDKPIILLKRALPDRTPYDFKLFSEIDKQTLELGDIISHKELKETILYRLENDTYKISRDYWKEKLIGKFDGKASIRVADIILSIK